jgi:citrate synthase
MASKPEWITAHEAAARLDVKLATLYAYASRRWLVRVPNANGRGSRYARSSVEQLKARHDARAGHGAVAASALRWGEPSLETSISEIRSAGPAYRGHGLLELCEHASSFESVACLLWTGQLREPRWPRASVRVALPRRPTEPHPLAFLAAAIASAALQDRARAGASDAQEHARAARLLRWLAQIAGGRALRCSGSIAECLLAGYGVRATAHALHAVDRALIMSADHELNPSTFAVRVTASTGADLYACLLSGLGALSGPKHGGVSARVEALLREIGPPARAAAVVRARLARGEAIPGFGHPLYPGIDPRAAVMLQLAAGVVSAKTRTALATARALLRAMERADQPAPNIDVALVVLCRALGLPEGAPAALFAVGRMAGWTAHALEQRAQGYVMRPRARYVSAPRAR